MASLDKIIDQILDDVVKKTIKLCYEYIEDIFRENLNNEEQVHEIKTTFNVLINYKNNDCTGPDINVIKDNARQTIINDYNVIIEEEVQCNIENIKKDLRKITEEIEKKDLRKVTEEIEKVQDDINDFSNAISEIFWNLIICFNK